MAHFVTFTLITGPSPGLNVTALANGPCSLTGGFGGWEVIDRPKRVGLTRFKGKDPFRQDIPILFDGYIEQQDQQPNIYTLLRMAEQPEAMQEPPRLRVSGLALRQDLDWLIETIDMETDMTIKAVIGGNEVVLRQSFIVHLLQYVADQIITTPAKLLPPPKPIAVEGGAARPARIDGGIIDLPSSGIQPPTNPFMPHPLSLEGTSQQLYGDPSLWKWISDANPNLSSDPRVPVPRGTIVVIPRG